jgi:hypothetical protein
MKLPLIRRQVPCFFKDLIRSPILFNRTPIIESVWLGVDLRMDRHPSQGHMFERDWT